MENGVTAGRAKLFVATVDFYLQEINLHANVHKYLGTIVVLFSTTIFTIKYLILLLSLIKRLNPRSLRIYFQLRALKIMA